MYPETDSGSDSKKKMNWNYYKLPSVWVLQVILMNLVENFMSFTWDHFKDGGAFRQEVESLMAHQDLRLANNHILLTFKSPKGVHLHLEIYVKDLAIMVETRLSIPQTSGLQAGVAEAFIEELRAVQKVTKEINAFFGHSVEGYPRGIPVE